MFGRRPSAQVVFVGSLIGAIVMAIIAVREATLHSWVWAGVWGLVTLVFAVDAIRAWGWTKGDTNKSSDTPNIQSQTTTQNQEEL